MHQTQYDCCVIGGGMVGAAIALGLAKQSYKVVVLEKHALLHYDPKQAPDLRLSALNIHAVALLSSLGAWQHVQKMRYRPYDTLSVWDAEQANFGLLSAALSGNNFNRTRTQFTAKEVNQPWLGYFVENRLIQLALFNELNTKYRHHVDCIHEQQINIINAEQGTVALSNDQIIKAKLIVGADGVNSKVREAAGIATSGWQYSQQANAILIKTKTKVPNETWQAFHKNGPRALLPMYDNFACLVWYDNAETSKQIQQAPKNELTQLIKENFLNLTQEFEIISVAGFGLTRMHAHSYGKGKAVIVGDAAHSINPLAGQGLNLGFQDVSALLNIIQIYGIEASSKIISNYEQKRKIPNLLMMSTMDVIYKSFSSSILPFAIARNLGLAMADNAGPLKRKALKYAMGIKE